MEKGNPENIMAEIIMEGGMKTQIELSTQTEISDNKSSNIDHVQKQASETTKTVDGHYTPLGDKSHSIIERPTQQTIRNSIDVSLSTSISSDDSCDSDKMIPEPQSIVKDLPTLFDLATAPTVRTAPKPVPTSTQTSAPPIDIDYEWVYERKDKYHMLCKDFRFFGRTLTLILLLLLLTLSIAYCIGKRLSVTLELIKRCKPKKQEEIWHHSYLASLVDGAEGDINAESQHGLTSE
eukprot:825363_1